MKCSSISCWIYFLSSLDTILGQSAADRYSSNAKVINIPPCPSSAQAINDTSGSPRKCLPRHSDMCGSANACCFFNQIDYFCCAGVDNCPSYGNVTMVIYRGLNPNPNSGTPYEGFLAQPPRASIPNFDQYPGVRGPPPTYGGTRSIPVVPPQPYQPVATPAPVIAYSTPAPVPSPVPAYGIQPQPGPVCSSCMGQNGVPPPGQAFIPIQPGSGSMTFVVPQPGALCSTCTGGIGVGGYGVIPQPVQPGGYGSVSPVQPVAPIPAQSYGSPVVQPTPATGYGGQTPVGPQPNNLLCPTCNQTGIGPQPPTQTGYGINPQQPIGPQPQPGYGINTQPPIAPQPQPGYGSSDAIPSQPKALCPTCNITGGQNPQPLPGTVNQVVPQTPLSYDGTGNLVPFGNQPAGYGTPVAPVAPVAPLPSSSYSAVQPVPQPSSNYGAIPSQPNVNVNFGNQPAGYGTPVAPVAPVVPLPSSSYSAVQPVPQPSSNYGAIPSQSNVNGNVSSSYGTAPAVPASSYSAPQPSTGYGQPTANMLCPSCSLQAPPGMPFIAVMPGGPNAAMQFVMPQSGTLCSTCAVQPTGSQIASYSAPALPSPAKGTYGGIPVPPPSPSNSYASIPSQGFQPVPSEPRAVPVPTPVPFPGAVPSPVGLPGPEPIPVTGPIAPTVIPSTGPSVSILPTPIPGSATAVPLVATPIPGTGLIPSVPSGSSLPSVPSLPSGPALPSGPGLPAIPSLPSGPALPSGPGLPAVPSLPSGPALPSGPELPAVPSLPSGPALPSVPSGPQVPTLRIPSALFLRNSQKSNSAAFPRLSRFPVGRGLGFPPSKFDKSQKIPETSFLRLLQDNNDENVQIRNDDPGVSIDFGGINFDNNGNNFAPISSERFVDRTDRRTKRNWFSTK